MAKNAEPAKSLSVDDAEAKKINISVTEKSSSGEAEEVVLGAVQDVEPEEIDAAAKLDKSPSDIELDEIDENVELGVVQDVEPKKADDSKDSIADNDTKPADMSKGAELKNKKPAEKRQKIDTAEAAEISDTADMFDGEEHGDKKEPVKKEVKRPKQPGTAVDGMVRTAKTPQVVAQDSDDAVDELFEKTAPSGKKSLGQVPKKVKALFTSSAAPGEPKFSRARSAIFAVCVALIVGLIGGVIMWLTSRGDVTYCTVQFESNGGSEVDSEEVVCGKRIDRPDDPSKDGFDFVNWVFEGLEFNFDRDRIATDMILVARWQAQEGTETVTVTFNSNGGSSVSEREVAKGKTMTAPIPPTRSGYSFDDWYLGDKEFDFSKPITENITLTAHWIRDASPAPTTSESNETRVTSLSIKNIEMETSDTKEFSATIVPAAAKYDLRISQAGNTAIAECSIADGAKNKITCKAISAGDSTVTITDTLSGKTAKFKIVVTEKYIPVAGLIAKVDNATSITLDVNTNSSAQYLLTTSVTPTDATNKNVTWQTNDQQNLISVTNGILKLASGSAALSANEATVHVWAKSADNGMVSNYITVKIIKSSTGGNEGGNGDNGSGGDSGSGNNGEGEGGDNGGSEGGNSGSGGNEGGSGDNGSGGDSGSGNNDGGDNNGDGEGGNSGSGGNEGGSGDNGSGGDSGPGNNDGGES